MEYVYTKLRRSTDEVCFHFNKSFEDVSMYLSACMSIYASDVWA